MITNTAADNSPNRTRKSVLPKSFLPLSLGLGALLATSGGIAAAQQITTVATGLNNPRGLAFGPNASLYVAEAGLGAGDGNGGFGVGVGFTGAITEIRNVRSAHPTAREVVTGLASIGDTENGFPEVVGPDGLSFQREEGLYLTMAESVSGVLTGDPSLDPNMVGQFGQLLRLTWHHPRNERQGGKSFRLPWKVVADVGDFNYGWTGAHKDDPWAPLNPPPAGTPQFPDANPYAVLALRGHQYVVDAGANTLNEVRADGTVRLIAFFPNPMLGGHPVSDSVPTCIAQGPDGSLYVGTLAFGANAAAGGGGQSVVYRVNPSSPTPVVWADGLNPITGCGFGQDGAFYVTEYTTHFPTSDLGEVVRIAVNSDGSAGARTALGYGALHSPNGFACGPDGAIYVSNYSISTAADSTPGEVVRVNY